MAARGGKRDGAGRKPVGDSPTTRVTITLTDRELVYLRTLSANLSESVRVAIEQAMSANTLKIE